MWDSHLLLFSIVIHHHFFDLIHIVNLLVNAHLRELFLLGVLLELCHDVSFSFGYLSLVPPLSHPSFVGLRVVTLLQLLNGFHFNLLLALVVSQLRYLVSFIQFFLNEPLLHLVDSRIVHEFFVFGILKQL